MFDVTASWANLRWLFAIQGLSPLDDLARFRHQGFMFDVTASWANLRWLFAIQGLSPLDDLARFRHQFKLTFGRRA